MFRSGLLITTALVIVGSLSFLAAQSAANARPAMAGPGRDRNNQFLCAYGGFKVSSFSGGSSSTIVEYRTRVAVPFTGSGKRVNRIVVKEGAGTSSQFSAGIYSNAPSGFPGKLIAGGRGSAGSNCRLVKISIPPTKLESNKTYWLEEGVNARDFSSSNSTFWAIKPLSKKRAYIQTHRYSVFSSSVSSSTSPWMQQTQGPWFRVNWSKKG